MSMNNYLRIEDLVNNPTPSVPICLCLDTSGSITAVGEDGYTRIEKLQQGIQQFYQAIKADEMAVYSAEISVVTFDDDAKCLLDFANIERQEDIPALEACGLTAMGEGVNMALDLLEQRKQEYKEKGVDYYQPWLVVMADGIANGSPEALERAINRTRTMVNNKKLTIFPIGIGNESDMGTLNRFSPNRAALKLQGLKFQEFFAWLSQSVSRTSQSTPGEKVKLDVEGLKGWAEL